MANETKQVDIPLIDDLDAPVVFADELTGGGTLQGNFNMTFAVAQYNHSVSPPRMYRKVCLRLVMPLAAATGAAQFLNARLQPAPEMPVLAVKSEMN